MLAILAICVKTTNQNTSMINKISQINRDYNSSYSTARPSKPKLPFALAASTLFLLALVFVFKFYSPSQLDSPAKQQVVSIKLPALPAGTDDIIEPLDVINHSKQSSTNALKTTNALNNNVSKHTVKAGESLAKIFQTQHFSPSTLYKMMNSGKAAKSLKSIKPGQQLSFIKNKSGGFLSLEYQIDRIQTLKVSKTDAGFNTELLKKPVEIATDTASVKIENSLYYDGKQAGISDKTIMELANIFGWDIDFALNIRKNDSFALIYETKFIEGERIENGQILAAEFINRGEKYQAVRFVDKDGHAEYFSPDGKSMRKTFLRSPVDFARVSSRFNLRRKHPVLNRIRAHKGVDYAAASGTPIKATSDGKVVFRGRKGGYGRVVILKHGQKYSTLYAHMSKYGRYKNGSHVKQGQVIGYIGKSGLATGPHLHYEFRLNGVHRNPLTVKFPAAKPVAKNQLASFKQQTSPLISQLELAKQTQLALN